MRWLLRRILGRRPPQEVFLLAMRLDDMALVHPQMDDTRHCSRCGERLGLYPSGQAFLATHPHTLLLCKACHPPPDVLRPVPGSLAEIGQGIPRSR